MKVQVSELSGPALDWAVAKVEGHHLFLEVDSKWRCEIGDKGPHDIGAHGQHGYSPSTDWSHGGPLLDAWDIQIASTDDEEGYPGRVYLDANVFGRKPGNWGSKKGPTILVAAMRAIVSSQVGEEIEIPQELTP